MFNVKEDGYTIEMVVGDFGIELPIEIVLENNESLTDADNILMEIFNFNDNVQIISKRFNFRYKWYNRKLWSNRRTSNRRSRTYIWRITWNV